MADILETNQIIKNNGTVIKRIITDEVMSSTEYAEKINELKKNIESYNASISHFQSLKYKAEEEIKQINTTLGGK